MTGKNRMIFDPKDDGTYGAGTAEGEVLAISIPRSKAAVIRTSRSMPYGLFVPEVPSQ